MGKVTVNILPLPIAGTTVICQGNSATLTDPIGPGTWTSGDTAVLTIGATTGTYIASAPGTAVVTYTLPTTCATSTIVFVNPGPAPITGNPAICVGLTSALADTTTGGAWSSSASGIASVDASGVVTGVAAGTAIISYLVPGTSCPAIKHVIVNPLPVGITGGMNVCAGSSTTLTDGVPGGTWSSLDPATATIDPVTGHVVALITGSPTPVSVTIVYTLGAGCDTNTTIMVNPLPLPITGPHKMCEGDDITLNDATTGGYWMSSNPARTPVDSFGNVHGIARGVVTISYSYSYSGAPACSATYPVTVNPQPGPIFGALNVCIGGSIALHDTSTGGNWVSLTPLNASITSTTGIVTGHNVGTSTIIYSLPGGCFNTTVVHVFPLPIVYSVTGGGNYCAEGLGMHIGLSGSELGSTYLLYHGASPVGTFIGTGSPIDFGLMTVAGSYTAIATSSATSCTNNMAGSAVIGIIPSVVPSVGINTLSDTVCNGSTTLLTAIPVNGGTPPSYVWNVNGVDVAVGSSYSYIPADGDIVKVTMTSTANCAVPLSVNRTKVLTVQPFGRPRAGIAASPGDTVCQGSSVTVTAVPVFGGPAPSYNWFMKGFPADIYLGSGPSYTYVPDNGDSLYVVMASNYHCRLADVDTAAKLRINVDSPAVPVVAINSNVGTVVAIGTSVTLTAVVTGGSSYLTYQWFINGIPVSGATNSVFTHSGYNHPKADSVECMVISHSLCPITSFQWIYIVVTNVGVGQMAALGSDISVLPNPNKGEFMVKGTLGSTTDEEVTFEITDILGQVVYRNAAIARSGKLDEHIQLSSNIANGMYILNLRSGTDSKVFHIVIEQ